LLEHGLSDGINPAQHDRLASFGDCVEPKAQRNGCFQDDLFSSDYLFRRGDFYVVAVDL